MAEKVGIVAVAQTKYHPNRADVNEGELVYEPVKKVLEETGLKYGNKGKGIDASIECAQDMFDGNTISNINVMSHIGAHLSDEDKICEDSINGLHCALARILSGHHDIILVASYCKESQTNKSIVENCAFDPIFLRLLGLDFTSAAAMQAMRYMSKYGITEEQCAMVAVKNRGNAKNNPYAQEPLDITIKDVLASSILASPIRKLDSKPVSDGACAMILARESLAKKLAKKPVWILGAYSCYETHYPGNRELANCDALINASKKAYSMSGITDPLKQIDVAELSEEYSYQELLWMEGLGLCQRGEAGKLIDSGITKLGGKLPVNTGGGMLSGKPTIVAGMANVAEAVMQLRGEADKRQVPGAKVALAHGVTGICGQHQAVMILGN